MKIIANASYRIHYNWTEEVPLSDSMSLGKGAPGFLHGPDEQLAEGLPKTTRSRLLRTYKGDVEGDGETVYLTMYRSDSSVSYVGLERIIGRLGGKGGSFVLQRTGVFETDHAEESYSVVPGSGTGALLGLTGEGRAII